MFFNIDSDSGGAVTGWLLMENVAEVPEFTISVPDRRPIEFKANVFRQDLYNLGVHATGMAGFQIDDQLLPDIAELSDFTLSERTTGLPLYRRSDQQRYVERKFLFIEVAAFPQVKMLRPLMQHFTMRYPLLERHTLDTINAVIAHNFSNSIFASGQINWMRHGDFAREKGFITAALLRDPFEELAERFLFLNYLLKNPSSGANGNYQKERFLDLLNLIQKMDFHEPRSILTALRTMTGEQRRLLRSPMTSLFGCTPDEDVQRRHVSAALDNLAEFNVVGTREHFREFSLIANGFIGAPVFSDNSFDLLPGTKELAQTLSGIGLVVDLLDEDIALHNFASEAILEGLKVPTTGA